MGVINQGAQYASIAETNTGTETSKAVTPDGLAGSNYGTRILIFPVFGSGTAVTVGDGTQGMPVTSEFNGYNIIDALAVVHDKGVTGTTDIQIRRRRAGSDVDVLSTKITIGDEFFASDGVVNTSNDDLATGDMLYVDRDAIHSGTAPNGLSLAISVRLP
jgi:hypothetical protein